MDVSAFPTGAHVSWFEQHDLFFLRVFGLSRSHQHVRAAPKYLHSTRDLHRSTLLGNYGYLRRALVCGLVFLLRGVSAS